ncbi:MAG: hypothetical protein IIY61_02440 [Ruminococcus sp.]|nr:hypothetical protein [Ruminococcus sp.]
MTGLPFFFLSVYVYPGVSMISVSSAATITFTVVPTAVPSTVKLRSAVPISAP